MSITHRVKRLLGVSLAGAMVLALMPAGIAAADGHEDGESDGVEACEGSEGLVEFNDSLGFFESEIECMAAFGITVGDADGNYNSTGTVTRQQMALFIARLASQALNGDIDSIPESEDDAFDDIADINPPEARDAINWLAALEITVGAEGGDSYNPSGDVTRQQMASFIARAHVALGVDFDGIEVDDERFTDVDADNVHVVNINLLAAAGVVEGTGDGTTYSPANSVTRGQMSAFIVRSIGVLDSQGLWNGVFVVTPVVDTNQTFMVAADETQVPTDTEINVSASVGDADEVTIWVLDADDVTVTDGVVTFETNNDGEFAAGPGSATIIEVDGVAVPATLSRTVTVTGGELDVVVNATAAEEFVVLVAETDGAAPELVDGAPVEAFGVTPTIAVQDIAGLGIFKAGTDDLVINTLLPEGQDQDVTVVLADADFGVVALDGESIDYVIASVDSTVRCDELQAGDDPTFGEVVVSTSAMTVGGAVSFTVPGGADGDVHCVVPVLDADEDGLYADSDGAAAFLVDGHGAISYEEDVSIGTTATFVDGDDQFVALNGTAAVQVEVLDQFGNPSSGVTVTFETDGSTPTSDRATNASGIASFAFSESDNGLVTVTATIDEVEDVTDAIAVGSVEVYWYEAAADGEAHAGEVLYLSGDSSWVVIDDAGVFLRVDVESGQLYDVDGTFVTFAAFTDALEGEADRDFAGADNTQLAVDDNYGVAATTTYTLTTATSALLTGAEVDSADPSTFGETVGDTLTLTFNAPLDETQTVDEGSMRVYFGTAASIACFTADLQCDISGDTITYTVGPDTFSRDLSGGETVTDIDDLVDTYGQPVIIDAPVAISVAS